MDCTLAAIFSFELISRRTVSVFKGSIPPRCQEQVPPSPISVSEILPPFLLSDKQWPKIPLIAIYFVVRMVI